METIKCSVMAASTSTSAGGDADASTSHACQDGASTSRAGCSSTVIILDDDDSDDGFHWSGASD